MKFTEAYLGNTLPTTEEILNKLIKEMQEQEEQKKLHLEFGEPTGKIDSQLANISEKYVKFYEKSKYFSSI